MARTSGVGAGVVTGNHPNAVPAEKSERCQINIFMCGKKAPAQIILLCAIYPKISQLLFFESRDHQLKTPKSPLCLPQFMEEQKHIFHFTRLSILCHHAWTQFTNKGKINHLQKTKLTGGRVTRTKYGGFFNLNLVQLDWYPPAFGACSILKMRILIWRLSLGVEDGDEGK